MYFTDFWVIKLKNYMQSNPNQNYVITDVRFQNEIQFVHSMNGILVEVQREVTPHWYEIPGKANRGDYKAEEFMLKQSGIHESEWRWIGGSIDSTS
jgi:hypothetical protein